MSVERSFEAWEEVQRQGLDLADKLAHSFNGLIQSHSHHVITPPSFNWPNPHFDVELLTKMDNLPIHGVTSIFNKVDNSGINGIFDMGNRLGQVGADFGASLNGMVEQVFRRLPIPFRHDEDDSGVVVLPRMTDTKRNDIGIIGGRDDSRSIWITENDDERLDGEDDIPGFNLKSSGHLGRSQGTINLTSTYDSRTHDIESSLAARGDLWRIEASNGRSTSGSENSSLFLVQLGPVLFVRDSTLLLPVHLSKQHLLWYGYDRKASTFEKLPSPSHTFYRILLLIRHNGSPYKNGIHSLCPAVWSKHRRWLLMSMICLNPLTPSFVDLQFPNGQLTYVSGEGITTSTFLPFCGGLLQAQGQYPGEMKFSFSCKNKWGTRFTPMVQWPDKSFTFGLDQALAWKRSGLMVRPTIQLSLLPTFGGINPGLRGEFIHSLGEKLSLVYGCALTSSPSAYASVSVGRSKWNGNVGNSGVVLKLETPLGGLGRPSFSVQVNSGIEV